MRIAVACLLLLIAPVAAVVAFKQYQFEHSQPEILWNHRGEVLFFNASWCGPCQQMKPIVTQLRQQGYRLRDVDVDHNQTLAEKYGIRAVPTFVFVEGGSEVNRFSGGTSAGHLRDLLARGNYK